MRNATGDRANVVASPPVIFAAVLALGFILDWRWPASFLPDGWGLPLGFIIIFLAANIKLFAVRELVRIKSNLNVHRPTTDIATSGPYSMSRNPIYAGIVLLNVGIACFVNSLWVFLLTTVLVPMGIGICATKPRSGAGSNINVMPRGFQLGRRRARL